MKLEKKHFEAMELELEGVNIAEICRHIGIGITGKGIRVLLLNLTR